MQLDWQDHFQHIVAAAIADYQAAEVDFTAALAGSPPAETEGYRALRTGGAAAIYLHHYADVICDRKPAGVPAGDVGQVRNWLRTFCAVPDDVALLGDVADALKHSALDMRRPRQVAHRHAVMTTGSGWGELPFGEGKFGGAEQVIVITTTGPRALSGILHNVSNAWRAALPL